MDIDQQHLQAATGELPQISQVPQVSQAPHQVSQASQASQASQVSQVVPSWPAAQARPVMPVYSVEERLLKRRLRVFAGRLALCALDAIMLNVAFIVAYTLRYSVLKGVTITTQFVAQPFSDFAALEATVTVGMLATFWLKKLYTLRATGTWFKQFWTIASATTIAFAVFSAYDYIFRNSDFFVSQTRALVTFTWVAIIIVVSLARLLVSFGLSALYKRGVGLANVLIVGSGRLGKLMMQQIAASPYLGYRVVGFIHDLDGPPIDFGRFSVLGTMTDVDTVIRGYRISEVIIALPSHQHQQILNTVRVCERAGADFKLVPDLYELSLARIDVNALEGVPLIGLKRNLTSSWQYRVKRARICLG